MAAVAEPIRKIYGVSMTALIEPPMIAVMEPFINGQKAIIGPASN
jgi:hypothetical protein